MGKNYDGFERIGKKVLQNLHIQLPPESRLKMISEDTHYQLFGCLSKSFCIEALTSTGQSSIINIVVSCGRDPFYKLSLITTSKIIPFPRYMTRDLVEANKTEFTAIISKFRDILLERTRTYLSEKETFEIMYNVSLSKHLNFHDEIIWMSNVGYIRKRKQQIRT